MLTEKYGDNFLSILEQVNKLLEKEPLVVDLPKKSSVLFVSDIHGDLDFCYSALETFKNTLASHIVFLGDYVDRGDYQIESLSFVLSLKLSLKEKVILLRGNHESVEMNKVYGFSSVLRQRFRKDFKTVEYLCNELYKKIPVVVKIDKWLGVHGGVPSCGDLKSLENNPMIVEEILWNDPLENVSDFVTGWRGGDSKFFGESAARSWLQKQGCNHLVRAHESRRPAFQSLWNGLVIHLYGKKSNPFIFGLLESSEKFFIVEPSGKKITAIV